jgi:hypothetical protein
MAKKFEKNSQRDVRVAATTRIWSLATVMLGICIPLTALSRGNPILPLAVITGAAVGTVAVWQSSDKKSPNSALSPNTVEALSERIANLEMIVGTDEITFQHRLNQLDASDKVKEV